MRRSMIIQWMLGFLASLCAIVALLVASVEAVAYNGSFFAHEYDKYQVQKDLRMEREDVLALTEEMMGYLRGRRDDLNITAVIEGLEQEFFSDREKAHMVDVKNLLQNAIAVRRSCMALGAAMILALLLLSQRPSAIRILAKAYRISLAGMAAFVGVLALLVAGGGFTRYWELFHAIFFDNDLWLLNPAEDRMILMLPEGFFFDMIATSLGIFAVVLGVLFVASLFLGKNGGIQKGIATKGR